MVRAPGGRLPAAPRPAAAAGPTAGGAADGSNVTCSSRPPRHCAARRAVSGRGPGRRQPLALQSIGPACGDRPRPAAHATEGGTGWRSATPRNKRPSGTASASTTPTCSPPRWRPSWPTATGSVRTCAGWSSRWPQDGWLGIGWPTEYGGQGRSAIEQYIFFDESMRAGAPVPMLTINTVGPTIMQFGTPEQKDFFLPKILAGEIHFCIGYTEPESGTDLASLQTRAVRDGDEYVINGQKIYTSLAGGADYIWLATRTDPEVAKHKGISMFIVPDGHPGHQGGAHAPARRPQHQLHLLRGRAGAGGQPGRGREQRVVADHQPAQSRAGHPVLGGDHRAGADRRAGRGPRTPSWPTAAGSSTRSGCRSTWPASMPGSSSSS